MAKKSSGKKKKAAARKKQQARSSPAPASAAQPTEAPLDESNTSPAGASAETSADTSTGTSAGKSAGTSTGTSTGTSAGGSADSTNTPAAPGPSAPPASAPPVKSQSAPPAPQTAPQHVPHQPVLQSSAPQPTSQASPPAPQSIPTSRHPAATRAKAIPSQPSNSLGSLNTRRASANLRELPPSFTSSIHTRPNADDLLSGGPDSASARHTPVPASTLAVQIDNPDPEVVRVVGRHLVSDVPDTEPHSDAASGGAAEDFDSLRLQSGDITRQLYNWQKEHEQAERRPRARSFASSARPSIDPETLTAHDINVPGGFRRSFLLQRAMHQQTVDEHTGLVRRKKPTFIARNFIEFLTLYGHFAGEELEEEEDSGEFPEYGDYGDFGESGEFADSAGVSSAVSYTDESAPLSGRPKLPRTRSGFAGGKTTATKAVLLLLKSFVGTGVLFLPKAFYNGGLLFSSLVLLFFAALSYWCFLLLVQTSRATGVTSFGDLGGSLLGTGMRKLVLFSIVISQIGFAAAYIVFTAENLRAFVVAVAGVEFNIETMILVQLSVFLPLSMIRNIAKLSGTALIADFFILLGLLYLYFWSGHVIASEGVADVALFNRNDWTLFIGTAIFTFEGIGLIIPIQESMRKPQQFEPVLAGVMMTITAIFLLMGILCYCAFGSEVQTVVILNLPQESPLVNGIQLLYSLAILLSTPLQLFPAIRIMENGIFIRSGKYNTRIKWQKNFFRFLIVIGTAMVAWGGADDLDRFVALTGSFACIPLVYIYPPILHLKAFQRTSSWWGKALDVLVFVGGVVALVYTSSSTIYSWIRS